MPCKYPSCGFDGEMSTYVGFFKQETISRAYNYDRNMPKYGFHLGKECPRCGKWQQWETQTDENMLGIKFYQDTMPKSTEPNQSLF